MKRFQTTILLIFLALQVDFLAAIRGFYWIALGKRVRGTALLLAAASQHQLYHIYWVQKVEPKHWRSYATHSAIDLGSQVAFLIIADASDDQEAINSSLESVTQLLGPNVKVAFWIDAEYNADGCMYFSPEAKLNDIVQTLSRPYILPLMAGDRLASQAQSVLTAVLNDNSESVLIYWDDDIFVEKHHRREDPWFKTDWNELHFYSQDYLFGACMVRNSAVKNLNIPANWPVHAKLAAQIIDIATQQPGPTPLHIDMILCHRRKRHNSNCAFRRTFIQDRLGAQTEGVGCNNEILHIYWPLPAPAPSVSIIVPTRDRIDLLSKCIAGLDELNYSGELQILVVDNESASPESHSYFETLKTVGIDVITAPGPFNFSAINNTAVAHSRGDYLCFLNNDIEMLNGDWLTTMLQHAARPTVGAVGAKLLYPDGTIQHAGVAIGVGQAAGHIQRNVADDQPGYFELPHVTRYVTAVTGACLVVSRMKFGFVGGFDEQLFPVAFNDVDLCLKLVAAGWKNVYAAEAKLIHHESKSRGDDMSLSNFARYSRELANLQNKWETKTYRDPYLSRRFSRRSETLYVDID